MTSPVAQRRKKIAPHVSAGNSAALTIESRSDGTAQGLQWRRMHSYHSSLFHCVFSTKDRRSLIAAEIRKRMWAYLGGTARELGMKAFVVGGTEDHVHLLLSLPGRMSIAEAIQKLKANSSRFMHEAGHRLFGWQRGYGAFSVGIAQAETTIRYINGQAEHHQKIDFRTEFSSFLKKHGIEVEDDM